MPDLTPFWTTPAFHWQGSRAVGGEFRVGLDGVSFVPKRLEAWFGGQPWRASWGLLQGFSCERASGWTLERMHAFRGQVLVVTSEAGAERFSLEDGTLQFQLERRLRGLDAGPRRVTRLEDLQRGMLGCSDGGLRFDWVGRGVSESEQMDSSSIQGMQCIEGVEDHANVLRSGMLVRLQLYGAPTTFAVHEPAEWSIPWIRGLQAQLARSE